MSHGSTSRAPSLVCFASSFPTHRTLMAVQLMDTGDEGVSGKAVRRPERYGLRHGAQSVDEGTSAITD